jgi:hypothetical protein
MVQRAIAVGANAIMFRLRGSAFPFHQRDKCLLKHILSLGVRQAEGSPIKEQLRSPGAVQALEPCRLFALNIHKLTG